MRPTADGTIVYTLTIHVAQANYPAPAFLSSSFTQWRRAGGTNYIIVSIAGEVIPLHRCMQKCLVDWDTDVCRWSLCRNRCD